MLVLSLFRISIVTFSALLSFTTAGHSNFLLIKRTTSGRTAGTTSTTPLLDPSRALKMNSEKRYIKICRDKYLTKNLSRFYELQCAPSRTPCLLPGNRRGGRGSSSRPLSRPPLPVPLFDKFLQSFHDEKVTKPFQQLLPQNRNPIPLRNANYLKA